MVAIMYDQAIESSDLMEKLGAVCDIDPGNIQFFSADWFWERQINSYALQVEPDRFKRKDTAIIDYMEALHIPTKDSSDLTFAS